MLKHISRIAMEAMATLTVVDDDDPRLAPIGRCEWCRQKIYEPFCSHSDHCEQFLVHLRRAHGGGSDERHN